MKFRSFHWEVNFLVNTRKSLLIQPSKRLQLPPQATQEQSWQFQSKQSPLWRPKGNLTLVYTVHLAHALELI